ncbi:hypothetical protein [Streptomyces sp. NPDC054834]
MRGPNKEFEVLGTPDGCNDSAGFESWRRKVWGSDVARPLGARYLPLLDGDRMEVPTAQLPLFLEEIALLRARMDVICAAVELRPSHIVSRLDNIGAADPAGPEGRRPSPHPVTASSRDRRPRSGQWPGRGRRGVRGERQRGLGPSPRVHGA